ncbi:universal stress protein, partial [Lapillicoccus jejuensis]
MTTHPATGAVVVGIDPDGSSDAALDWAADDAARRHRPLLLLAAPAPLYSDPMAGAIALLPATESLGPVLDRAAARVAERAPSVEVRRTTAYLAAASPAAPLTEVSRVADTVVVGSHGRGRLATLLMGSVSQSVAAGAGCPVVVVREAPRVLAPETPRHVVVGVDGSPVSAEAVGYAFAQADARGVA